MNKQIFKIVSGTDKDYVNAIEAIKAEGDFIYEKMSLDNAGQVNSDGIPPGSDIVYILDQRVRVLKNISVTYAENLNVSIERQPEQNSMFDTVTILRNDPQAPNQQYNAQNANFYNTQQHLLRFAKLTATVQKHLGAASNLIEVGNLLGPAVKEHLEAREIALARLEAMGSSMLLDMEKARKRRDGEFRDKEKLLEEKYQQKEQELHLTLAAQKADLDRLANELEAKSKILDDRAAKHARRQHYKDIKEKFQAWSETFHVTPGTKKLRLSVMWTTLVLLVLSGGLAAWFLLQTTTSQDSLHLIPAIAKQVTFTALFVTTIYFFIRWNNQWFQRHANEEFRLKRMELDIDRASWFVEMAFEWKDEKGEEIPDALIERLTHGLFGESRNDHAVEPSDSLLHALLGAAHLKVKLPGDVEAEYDRKEIKRLVREGKKREKERKESDKEES